MRFGRLRKDDDCHEYIIPENEVAEFDRLMHFMWDLEDHDSDEFYAACDELQTKFGQYRADGAELHDMRVVMPEDEENQSDG